MPPVNLIQHSKFTHVLTSGAYYFSPRCKQSTHDRPATHWAEVPHLFTLGHSSQHAGATMKPGKHSAKPGLPQSYPLTGESSGGGLSAAHEVESL